MFKRIIWLIIAVASVVIDQLTKWLAATRLQPVGTFPIIEDVLHLTYVENRGAAFGMLKDHRWIFMVTSTVAVIGILVFMLVFYKKYYHPLLYTGLSLIVGGGIGNMIDRVALGYVVDFIDFRLINFWVFNGADSFVCIGAALVVIYVFMSESSSKKSAVTE
ncbi:MAG: signal peptidase II [Clostridiales bacterium]|nr:signal peptidase II [Clostridiales bacterium]